MRAFTDTKVSKEQLLQSIRYHQEADHFRKGEFWNDTNETGCGVGCSIHDFAPGMESEHSTYEDLFGIPMELAVLEDALFEQMDREDDLGRWPKEFISAIPQGANLDRAAGRWLLKLLEHPGSPLVHAQGKRTIQTARELLRHWTQTGEAEPNLAQEALAAIMETKHTAAHDHTTGVAEQVGLYVRNRVRDEPYTTQEMLVPDSICSYAAISYSDTQEGVPKNENFKSTDREALEMVSILLLETLREENPEGASGDSNRCST